MGCITRRYIPNEEIVDEDGNTHCGISICNIPMGDDGYIKSYLECKKGSILTGFDRISNTLDPGH
jgi:hypothetical protein